MRQWKWDFIGEEDTARIRSQGEGGESLEFGMVVMEYLNEKKIYDFKILMFNEDDEKCEIIYCNE